MVLMGVERKKILLSVATPDKLTQSIVGKNSQLVGPEAQMESFEMYKMQLLGSETACCTKQERKVFLLLETFEVFEN